MVFKSELGKAMSKQTACAPSECLIQPAHTHTRTMKTHTYNIFECNTWKQHLLTLFLNNTIDSLYLEVQGAVWNTSRYPYLDIAS